MELVGLGVGQERMGEENENWVKIGHSKEGDNSITDGNEHQA